MGKISLRSYNQEIERLIESRRIDEAIAHSRYILLSFPRYIGVYRLLGKAYLEAKRFGDAADIFQRVLSSVPEDFVSHVGMSMIREDEGNLDEAIWHMERAFEIEPSNSTIQDELRRLIGKRDGIEPPRIRLTRGALSRMYIKGDLNQEAITELRIALAEDPNRLDLRVLLANALIRIGQRVEAAETASQVLRKLPNNLDSNRIMAELLAGSERDEEAQAYRKIVSGLDPYYNFVTPSNPASELVTDQAVSLDRLEWKDGQPPPGISDQPAWATSLGIKLAESADQKEILPDWLNTEVRLPDEEGKSIDRNGYQAPAQSIPSEVKDAEPVAFFSDIENASEKADEEIPEWMIEAGWIPSSTESVAPEPSTEKENASNVEKIGESDLDQAEIPDWLRDFAPVELTAAAAFEQEDQSELTTAIFSMEAAETPASEETLEKVEPPEVTESLGSDLEIPGWLSETIGDVEQPTETEAQESKPEEALPDWVFEKEPLYSSDTDLPPWLSETPKEDELSAESLASTQSKPAEDLPHWLFLEDSARPVEAGSNAGTPDWLMDESPSSETKPISDIPGVENLSNEIPSWLFEEDETAKVELTQQGEITLPQEETSDIEPVSSLEEASEQPRTTLKLPAWLLESPEIPETPAIREIILPPEPSPVESSEQATAFPDLKIGDETETLPAWLFEDELETSTAHSDLKSPEVEHLTAKQELPEWLDQLEEVPPLEEDTQPSQVSQVKDISNQEARVQPEISLEETLEHKETIPAIEKPRQEGAEEPSMKKEDTYLEDEAAFAWLESLAVKQGAEEALILPPEDRIELPPAWIQEASEDSGKPPAETPPVELSEPLPEWLSEAEIEKNIKELQTLDEILNVELPSIEPAFEEKIYEHPTPELEILEKAQSETASEEGGIIQSTELVEAELPALEEELPELPEWLAKPIAEPVDELEWTPPPVVPFGLVNLNTGSLRDLERLPGVGFIRAQNILNYREDNGPYTDINDLSQVPGFNSDLLEDIKDNVYIPKETQQPAVVEENKEVLFIEEGGPKELAAVRMALNQSKVDLAMEQYTSLIETYQYLPEVIQDLQEASSRYPENFTVWQSLGDAYFRADQIQNALKAYIQAEKLLI